MHWINVTSRNKPAAFRLRQILSKHVSRVVTKNGVEMLCQVRQDEDRWLDKMARDHNFRWRYIQIPNVEELYVTACKIEVMGKVLLNKHQKACYGCKRVDDPTYERQKRKRNRPPPPPPETSEETPPLQKLVDVVIPPPTTLAALVSEMSRQRDLALNLAAEYDSVIAAAQGIDSEMARLKEIEEQMETHRHALAAFVAPKNDAKA